MSRLGPSNRNVALMMMLGIEPDDVVYAEQTLGYSNFLKVTVLKRDESGMPIPLGGKAGFLTYEVTFSNRQVQEASDRLDPSTWSQDSRGDMGGRSISTLITPPAAP